MEPITPVPRSRIGKPPPAAYSFGSSLRSAKVSPASSLRFFAELEDAGETFADRKLDPNEYAAGGGFPIRLRGTGVIGSICVSGYPDHVDDHQLIINTLAEYFA